MRKLLLISVLLLGPAAAHADNGMLYLGAGVANDNLRDIAATNSNSNSTNWKVWAALRPISLFAVEADYIDLGGQTGSVSNLGGVVGSTHIDYKAYAGYAVGYVPIPLPYLDVFGKVGVERWTSSSTSNVFGLSFTDSEHGTGFAWGVGGQVHFGNFGGRLEFESFNISNTNGANVVSLSVFLNLF